MRYEEYIKTEPIEFIKWNIMIQIQELDEIKKYYQWIEEKLKQNEYYVQNHK